MRTRDLVALTGAQPQGGVITRVEEFVGPHRVAVEVEHLQVDVGLGTRRDVGERPDGARAAVGHPDPALADQAVSHCRRAVVGVGGAEVPVAVDQRVALGEVLRHAGERVVDRGVAVRVELAHDVADRGRALLVLAIGAQATCVHAVEDPAVHRLQAVTRVGKGARRDDRHRVIEEGALHLLLDLDRFDVRFERGLGAVGHS